MGWLSKIFSDKTPSPLHHVGYGANGREMLAPMGPDPLEKYLRKMSKKGELHLAPGFEPVGLRKTSQGWKSTGGIGPDGEPIPDLKYVGPGDPFAPPWLSKQGRGKRRQPYVQEDVPVPPMMDPRGMSMQAQYGSQGHRSLQGGMPMPPVMDPGYMSMQAQHGSQGHHSLQGGAPLAAPELRSRGESMQAQHGSNPHRPTGGVGRHDFANRASGRPPLPPYPAAPPRHGQIPEGAPLPTGFVDPLKTQSAPKPKGHYGMREHVPGMTALDVERHGRADDPAANFGLVSEIRRVHERARAGRYGNANGDARGSVVDPRVGKR
jgi:hypothetical protein